VEENMNWLLRTFGSSIGKKLMQAFTGLGFCGFLSVHLAGNLTLYGGKDAFDTYALKLHSLGPIITIAELGLLLFAAIHILTGTILFFQNLKARPTRYKVNKRGGGRTLGSMTMPYTGFLIIPFIVFHLINFHFADKADQTLYQIISDAFSKPGYVTIYIVAMIVVAIHVSHGFWSAFQTIGANHPKYMPVIKGAGIVFSLLLGVGFGFIPIYLALIV
jgi:succinate dehydrogenase / fumarate reductase cytochrome b subunit